MPKPPISPAAEAILLKPNAAVLASVRPDGSPHTAAVWYDWVDGRVLLSMDASRARLKFIEQDPRISLTVLDCDDWFVTVTVSGVAVLEPDDGLRGIDRLSQRYIGMPYPDRVSSRVTAWLDPDYWFLWEAHRRVKNLEEGGGQAKR